MCQALSTPATPNSHQLPRQSVQPQKGPDSPSPTGPLEHWTQAPPLPSALQQDSRVAQGASAATSLSPVMGKLPRPADTERQKHWRKPLTGTLPRPTPSLEPSLEPSTGPRTCTAPARGACAQGLRSFSGSSPAALSPCQPATAPGCPNLPSRGHCQAAAQSRATCNRHTETGQAAGHTSSALVAHRGRRAALEDPLCRDSLPPLRGAEHKRGRGAQSTHQMKERQARTGRAVAQRRAGARTPRTKSQGVMKTELEAGEEEAAGTDFMG